MCQQQICLSKYHKYAIDSQLNHVHIWDNYVCIYTSFQLSAINNVTTSIHTFHINDICPRANMPATLHMYLPLHIKFTLLYIQVQQASQYTVSSAVICICTIHLVTIFISYHQWSLTYSLLGRYILLSVIMPITWKIVHTCIPTKYW